MTPFHCIFTLAMDGLLMITHSGSRVLALPTMYLNFQKAEAQMITPYSPTEPGAPFQSIRYGIWKLSKNPGGECL